MKNILSTPTTDKPKSTTIVHDVSTPSITARELSYECTPTTEKKKRKKTTCARFEVTPTASPPYSKEITTIIIEIHHLTTR